jgi:HD superfamily phosphohydrolase
MGEGTKQEREEKNRRNFPVIATRASSRIARDGIPILEKATKRAHEKNQLQGTSRPNPFLILNNESNENLSTVMKDIGIVLENYDNQIDLFKAEERVRATIAEANYNKYVDKINSKNAPQTEEDLQELAMEAITNKERLEAPLISQEGPGGAEPEENKKKGRPEKQSKKG